jgi:dethiobiotin synthetase
MARIDFPHRLFVSGTDTGVGKTVLSAILTAGLEGTYWKPIQSGLQEITDTEWVREKTGLPETHFHPEAYRLSMPLSPHAAAAHDHIRIDLERIVPPPTNPGHLIIEGAGGLMVPLNERHFMLDLIKRLDLPVLLVARSTLGTINHTLLSLEQLRRSRVEILGVVLNGPLDAGNRKAIEFYGRVEVCAEMEPLMEINPESLGLAFTRIFG